MFHNGISSTIRPQLRVNSGVGQRLGRSPRGGWIFKSEVENYNEMAGMPPSLCNVVVVDEANDEPLSSPTAVALVDPKKTVVYGKILDLDPYCVFDQRFIVHLLERALHRRERFFSSDVAGNSVSYRLFHGESDGIPADQVVCVDKDGEALRLGQLSCDENGIRKGVVQFMENSVEEYLHGLAGNHAGHDVIVIDPPTIADKTERKSKNAKLHSIENVVAKAVPHLVSRGLLHVTNVPEGYSVYEGFMAVSILGYTLLTGACVVGMHLAYKQAILCDTDRIIQARGLTVHQYGDRLSPREVPMIAANHVSYLDIYVLESCGATPLSFVAKRAVGDMFLIGQLARAFDCVFVSRSKCPKERGDVVAKIERKQKREHYKFHHCYRQLSLGVITGSTVFQLCIFPEGTTTNGRSIIRFRKGAFEGSFPVQPVKLAYSSSHCAYTCLDLLYHILIFLSLACTDDIRCDVYWLPKVEASEASASTGVDLANATRLSIAREKRGPQLNLEEEATLEGHCEITDFLLGVSTSRSTPAVPRRHAK
ncbi:hypothetical protein Pmar_PMAR004860 [Perkinsus marinus ATCC 50983]|uniref:Phospholipid/glycerol acyltransferase domain-containing protein n=1 Tax=Perkinsus marinus (strain ATCC 50983 / TXsc) TaxID=423536 RepID=C5LL80_PERM5|nr:hypothetical protein Pmar_PMAR004860 [Perkinsus marinus ATCC 50983]EER02497.1 hypothetical protein Pmar_PMAR004860 [Perkinsus marinus ATCC 50983]|eukprot:XP_002769779.1 hypothetical protein Pmar_PMAR004860 [Perkinsus marinus ATCC 50983]